MRCRRIHGKQPRLPGPHQALQRCPWGSSALEMGPWQSIASRGSQSAASEWAVWAPQSHRPAGSGLWMLEWPRLIQDPASGQPEERVCIRPRLQPSLEGIHRWTPRGWWGLQSPVPAPSILPGLSLMDSREHGSFKLCAQWLNPHSHAGWTQVRHPRAPTRSLVAWQVLSPVWREERLLGAVSFSFFPFGGE